ncbi:MAG: hypothetical protein IT377_23425 [Polyangiaceae bacterium]|nr:hypothetical protein [Polyangiaceae bacterium]
MTRDSSDDLALIPEEQEEELARALRAAFAPGQLDPAVNEALIAAALEDPLAPPSDEEIAESERLRDALAGHGSHASADLARALRAAAAPAALRPLDAERVASRALGQRVSRRGRLLVVTFGTVTTAAVAIAASWFLVIAPALDGDGGAKLAAQAEALAVSRSTAGMFSEKFEQGATTARVDRIALARSRELRSNRYALWGVR